MWIMEGRAGDKPRRQSQAGAVLEVGWTRVVPWTWAEMDGQKMPLGAAPSGPTDESDVAEDD